MQADYQQLNVALRQLRDADAALQAARQLDEAVRRLHTDGGLDCPHLVQAHQLALDMEVWRDSALVCYQEALAVVAPEAV